MSKRLLVVEDSKSIASVIERMGRSLGYTVTIAHSFAVVKKLLSENHQFFVATVDYSLPDAKDGEVIPFLIERNVPSIIMTGRMDDATHKRISNFPIIDYITKENAQAYHYLLRILHGQLTNANIGVLVVDDSLTARSHVSQLLKRRNFNVYSVDSGPKAIAVLQEKDDIKIVITDQEMPGMDGIELVQTMRKQHAKNELIIIGLSGAERNFQSARFIKNGADDFLRKPFCPEEFYCRIMQSIEKLNSNDEKANSEDIDYLTGLLNRRAFLMQAEKLNKEAGKHDTNHLLALMTVDEYSQIVENYGYNSGDKLLESIAAEIKKYAKGHICARMESSEFAFLLTGEDIEPLEKVIENIRLNTEKLVVSTTGGVISATLSGGGILLDHEEQLHKLITISKQALGQAASSGGNRVTLEGFIDLS